jgi:hypothetical protein
VLLQVPLYAPESLADDGRARWAGCRVLAEELPDELLERLRGVGEARSRQRRCLVVHVLAQQLADA